MAVAALLVGLLLSMVEEQSTSTPVPAATIRGQVLNARTLAPVIDALVGLAELPQTARSTAAGRFEITGVKPGTYTLTVSTVGYIFVRRAVTVSEGTGLELTVPLAEGTGTYEETVKVTATPDPEARIASVELSSAALQDLRDIAADDPVRALQALPGASTGDDFRAEFSVRGSAFRHVGIVIDGTPTSLLFHTMGGVEDPGSIAMINTDVLQGASLSAGVHAQNHGDWIGATLAFDIREGSRDRRAMRVAVSGTNASVIAEGPIGPARRGSWLVSLRKSYVDWLVRKIEPGIEATIGFVDTQAKAGYDLTPRQHLSVTFVGGRANYEKSTATGANEVHLATSQSAMGSMGWRYTLDRTLLTQRVSFVTNEFFATGNRGQERVNGQTRSWLWRGDASFLASAQWQLDGGATAQHVSFGQTLRDFTAASGGGLRVRDELAFENRRTIASGWAQIVRRGTRGAITAGTRVSHDTATAVTRASPWIVAERTAGHMRVFGGVGRVNQFPTLEEVGEGVDPIVPEEAWGLDLGLAHALTPGLHWRIDLFQRQESNILRRVQEDRLVAGKRVVESPFPAVASSIEAMVRGVDIVLERRAATGLTGWVGYTWAHVRDHDVTTDERFDGDFDQRHTLNVFLQQRLSYRMKATSKLRIGSNFPIVGYLTGTPPDQLFLSDVRNQARLPTYVRLDLSGSRTFTYRRSRLTVFLELVNVFNRRNLGPGNGSIRSNLAAVNYTDRLLPFVPSAGMLLEF